MIFKEIVCNIRRLIKKGQNYRGTTASFSPRSGTSSMASPRTRSGLPTNSSENYVRMLVVSNLLREPVLRSAIQRLRLPVGSQGLDAGCGIGLQTVLLAEAVGPSGHVIGLDRSADFVAHARELVWKAGLSERIAFQGGNVGHLPFDNDIFDWAWSADCVGYAPVEPVPLLQELVRVVKPGGLVVILAWSSERLLPGYPLLEAHLNATSAGLAPFVHGANPERHFLRGLGWLRKAGFREVAAQTLVADARAPLSEELRNALTALLDMRWSGAESELPDALKTDYRRLCLPESPDFVLGLSDYYAFFTYTMFSGVVPPEKS